jgi:transcriptional regulator with XRE-family HTH domain
MTSKDKLLKYPNYLLSKYQAELYRQLKEYMGNNNLTQKKVAKQLGVSSSYINQILKGNFNFTLKKLIELSLMMGKVPHLEFLTIENYWITRENESTDRIVVQQAVDNSVITFVKVAELAAVESPLSMQGYSGSSDVKTSWVQQSLN